MLRNGTKADLVITDYAMPGVTGLELAAIIRQDWPGLPIILTSGYAEMMEEDSSLPLLRLPKPYGQDQLSACIATALRNRNIISLDSARRA
jgi:CheY-like chemotaxis protein